MDVDFVLLRELVETGSAIDAARDGGRSEASIRAVESAVGPLSRSYRWWLTHYGGGTVGGTEIATVVPGPETFTGRLDGERLCFYQEADCGDSYHFALDRRVGEEHAVVRRDHRTGDEEQVAESFAGFLSTREALAAGLGDGPNPTIARLWRSTPGVLLPDGVLVYGPQAIRERNETYEVREYAPHWVLIGDDSGGGGLLMRRRGRDRTSVFRLDLGAIEPDVERAGDRLTDDLIGWLAAR
ncbi:SMI1/KNR4 family protein [Saccharothrix sp. NRRL B-16348]|uniref:SMI1/KNR4 family protein n=1 Tax=Saccharothrix sp. NRRL B-16348 TaxID=1415542 RepID=UPI0006B032A4|nr:SMI1/KNR4 family protein [Saccharothrix sp. NRRL B-16348]